MGDALIKGTGAAKKFAGLINPGFKQIDKALVGKFGDPVKSITESSAKAEEERFSAQEEGSLQRERLLRRRSLLR